MMTNPQKLKEKLKNTEENISGEKAFTLRQKKKVTG